MALRLHRVALVVPLCLAASPGRAATCHVDPFRLFYGSDMETRMVVTSGATCGVSLIQGGPGRTVSAGGTTALSIAEQPRHGRAGTSGLTGWAYAPQKGYVGPDRFVVSVGGEIMYRRIIRGTTLVTVDVDVVR